jgi:hypothetical protein
MIAQNAGVPRQRSANCFVTAQAIDFKPDSSDQATIIGPLSILQGISDI